MTIIVCVIAGALYVVLSRRSPGSASGRPAPPPVLVIQVIDADCSVFVRRSGGEVLVNQTLTSGQSVHFDGPPFDVVVGDPRAVRVYVRGRLHRAGRAAFTVR